MELPDDGSIPMWRCTACDAEHKDVLGWRPRKRYTVRFFMHQNNREFYYEFESSGFVEDPAAIKHPRCVDCEAPAEFVYHNCQHEGAPSRYKWTDHMGGKDYAVEACTICRTTFKCVEITSKDWEAFAQRVLRRWKPEQKK